MRSDNNFTCYASCSFGLEKIVALELEALGLKEIRIKDARVYFNADTEELARANLWLRSADRIYIVLGEFTAKTFDELFSEVNSIEWEALLEKDEAIPVSGDAVQSVLMSVSDIQSVTKKAIVERLREKWHVNYLSEKGNRVPIYVSTVRDAFTVAVNTSGEGLNRRGYRVKNVQAPLRETLAAGIISISRWKDRPFYDIMCGSGTIVIEAALKACNIAPGLRRQFALTGFGREWAHAMKSEKEKAQEGIIKEPDVEIRGSDIDPVALDIARYHAKRAGVADLIRFEKKDALVFTPETATGTLITNPPYAVRLGNNEEIAELYRKMGETLRPLSGFRQYFICADPEFPVHYGMKEDSRRKLYNGNIMCYLFQYFRNR